MYSEPIQNLFIVEGLPGSGKTIVSNLLTEDLISKNESVEVIDLFGSKKIANFFSKLIYRKRRSDGLLHAAVSTYLHTMMEEIIIPSLLSGKTVVCERYYYSFYKYGISMGIEESFLLELYNQIPKPEIIYYVDRDIDKCFSSVTGRRILHIWELGLHQYYDDDIMTLYNKYYRGSIPEEVIYKSFMDYYKNNKKDFLNFTSSENVIVVDHNQQIDYITNKVVQPI